MSEMPKIFWLHVKKSAGQSTRKILGEYGLYNEVDRVNAPPPIFSKSPSVNIMMS